jgi:hypothetical protein
MQFARIHNGKVVWLGHDVTYSGDDIPPVVVLSLEEHRMITERIEELEAEVRKWQERFCNAADWAMDLPPAAAVGLSKDVQEARAVLEGKEKEA